MRARVVVPGAAAVLVAVVVDVVVAAVGASDWGDAREGNAARGEERDGAHSRGAARGRRGDGAGAGGVAARAAGEPDGNALAGQIREAREQLARFREEHDPNDAEHRKLLGPYRRARACAFCAGDRPGDLALRSGATR